MQGHTTGACGMQAGMQCIEHVCVTGLSHMGHGNSGICKPPCELNGYAFAAPMHALLLEGQTLLEVPKLSAPAVGSSSP